MADKTLMQGKYMVTLIEGDGIGPEISQSVKDIFTAAKVGYGFMAGNRGVLIGYRYPSSGKVSMSPHSSRTVRP